MNNERVVATFIELVKIDSESKNEGKFQEFLKQRFHDLGLTIYEDNTKEKTGLGANNLVCRLVATAEGEPLFFSSHVDTVAPGVGIQPLIKHDIIYSDGTTILGADDKAGIAIMLELIEQLQETKTPHGLLEFVLSPGEEIGLVGANAFDANVLESEVGFVLDVGGPVGSITMSSPTLMGLEVEITGTTAHAGLEPEKGVSAITIGAKAIAQMKLGRLDTETTANIGTFNGGLASNIVADKVTISAEARSISTEVCEAQIKDMVALFEQEAALAGGKISVSKDVKSVGYRFEETDPLVQVATKAIASIGRKATYDASGGGSDANVFNAQGKPTLNLSIGYEQIHTVSENLPIKELVKAVELAKALVAEFAKK